MRRLRALLFPSPARTFAAMRGVNITLRSLHLVAMAGYAGGQLAPGVAAPAPLWWWLTLLSGGALVLLFIWSDGRWLLQWRGGVILFKLGILLLLPTLEGLFAGASFWGVVAVIVLSSLIAHAPGRWRYRELFRLRGGAAL